MSETKHTPSDYASIVKKTIEAKKQEKIRAAAPDLLEACKLALRALSRETTEDAKRRALYRCQAAISKATG